MGVTGVVVSGLPKNPSAGGALGGTTGLGGKPCPAGVVLGPNNPPAGAGGGVNTGTFDVKIGPPVIVPGFWLVGVGGGGVAGGEVAGLRPKVRGAEKMEPVFWPAALPEEDGAAVDGLCPNSPAVGRAGIGGLGSGDGADFDGWPNPDRGIENIPPGLGGAGTLESRGGVFGRAIADFVEESVGGLDGVLAVSSSSELSSSPEMGALAKGELRVGRVEGRPKPIPTGVAVGLGATSGTGGSESKLDGDPGGVVLVSRIGISLAGV